MNGDQIAEYERNDRLRKFMAGDDEAATGDDLDWLWQHHEALTLVPAWEGPHLCCVLTEDNGSFCGRELPCPEHSDGSM